MHKQKVELEIFFDGACPLCVRDISAMQKRNHQGLMSFVDISARDFEPSFYGKTKEQFMAVIHGRTADGTWLRGVDLLARMYGTAGFRRLEAVLTAPLFHGAASILYRLFARYRPMFNRNPCQDGVCGISKESKRIDGDKRD